MTYKTILYAVDEAVATITLNRPEKLNAFHEVMGGELVKVFDLADEDDEIRVIIITGAGRAFSAGADLSRGKDAFDYASRSADSIETFRDGGGLVVLRMYEATKPIIAAINGPAVGFGVTMTLAADIRIASDSAKMGFVFTRRGIAPEACSSWFLPRVVGMSRAMEWILTGRVFSALEALDGGLVSRIVRDDALLPTARSLAREIAENTSAVSVALSRQLLWRMLGADHPMEAHKVDSRAIFVAMSCDAASSRPSNIRARRLASSSCSESTPISSR